MTTALLALFAIQGGAILFDEFYFHRRRRLPRWERVGHPVDTAGTIVCVSIAVFSNWNAVALSLYVLAGILSSLLITKDEKVHAIYCDWKEQWLHSVLFLVHSSMLILIGFVRSDNLHWAGARPWMLAQLSLMTGFFVYQTLYWNFSWVAQKKP